MLLLTYIFVAIYGLILGSFGNVLVVRDARRKSIVSGYSECPNCKHRLRWYELVPLLSWLAQAGKCRECKKPISIQYPLVELLMAAVFILVFTAVQDWGLVAQILMLLASFFIVVYSLIDLKTQEVPLDYIVVSGILAFLARLFDGQDVYQALVGLWVGMVIIQGIRLIWWLIRREEGMGSGDAWIAAALGVFVGYPSIFVLLFAAIIIGAIAGVIILSLGVKKGTQKAMPFGPFLMVGAFVALLWGERLIQWYTTYLGYAY